MEGHKGQQARAGTGFGREEVGMWRRMGCGEERRKGQLVWRGYPRAKGTGSLTSLGRSLLLVGSWHGGAPAQGGGGTV